MKKTIKKFSAFTLAIMMFFGAIFSAFADNTILLNPRIFNNDSELQERLQRIFREFNYIEPQYLTGSMYTSEKLNESGSEDYYSRTVRFYSLPALFGDENRPSALISDFDSMMSAANVHIEDVFDHFNNGRQHINEEKSANFKSKCENFCVAISDGITDPATKLMIRSNAYNLMAKFLKSFIIKNRREIPSWWDGFFHTEKAEGLIRKNKTISNIFEVSLLLATAIKEEKWKYTDENGETQYNDFLVTATDETITRPNPSWLTKWIWPTILNPECAPASVKFVKSNPPLYQIDVDLQQQLPRKYEKLYGEIWKFLKQFGIQEAVNVANGVEYDRNQKEIDRLRKEINKLKTSFEGTLGSMIATLAGLNSEERANFMAGWEALLRQFNANFVISQDAFNTLRNLNDRIASINRTLNNTNQHIDDLERGVNLQDEIIDALNNDLDALHERLDTLTERFHWDLGEFSTYINNVYRNHPSRIFKFVLRHLFPDQIIE